MDDDGLITIPSSSSVSETVDRLADAATSAGFCVFARVDHTAGVKEVEMPLRPTQLLPSARRHALDAGAPEGGHRPPAQGARLEDDAGRVWLTYNDAAWLARRHELVAATHATVKAIGSALARLATAASAS